MHDISWTVVPCHDTHGDAYQARTMGLPRNSQPGSAPVVANALGAWHYVADHGEDEARRLAEADGAKSGLPRSET